MYEEEKSCFTCKHEELAIENDPRFQCSHGCGKDIDANLWVSANDYSDGYSMSLSDLLALHESTCQSSRDIVKAKNHDYTNGSAGVFDNFKSSTTLGVHPVVGVMLRVQDKMKRIQTFVSQGKLAVEGEGVFDAISDTINYMILIKGMIIEEEKNRNANL